MEERFSRTEEKREREREGWSERGQKVGRARERKRKSKDKGVNFSALEGTPEDTSQISSPSLHPSILAGLQMEARGPGAGEDGDV